MVNVEYPFAPQTLDINGVSLSYLDEGPKGGATLIMLHGNPTWSFYYRKLISALSKTYRVIAPDHIGCGLSDKPQTYDYTLKTHIANVTRLIDHLEIKKFTLVVHDWGGAIGMGYAVDHPEKIEALVIFNTGAFRFNTIPLRIAVCRIPLLGAFLVRGLNGFARAAIDARMATEKPERFTKEVREGYLAPYNSWANRIGVHRFVQDIPMNASHQSYATLKHIEDGLAQFANTPSLIIWGMKDWCFHEKFLNVWREKLKNSQTHMMHSAGHYVVEDEYEKIIPLIENFLESKQ